LYLAGYGVWRMVASGRPSPAGTDPDRAVLSGALFVAIGLAWTSFCLEVAIPHFAPPGEGFRFLDRWSSWGTSPLAVLAGWITHPLEVIDRLLGRAPLRLFGAMLFVPFLPASGPLLFAAPWLLNVTSDDGQQSGLSLYYGIPVVAFASVAAVEGLRTRAFRRLARSRAAAAAVILAVILNVAHFRFPPIAPHRAEFLRALREIPPGATVQAMSCFFPVLDPSYDRRLIDRPAPIDAPWAVIRTRSTTWPLSGAQAEELLRQARADGYRVLADLDGAVLLHAGEGVTRSASARCGGTPGSFPSSAAGACRAP
jgi:hypothetical protein